MPNEPPHTFFIRRIWIWVLSVGPGIFCAGAAIGTGSVTTMAKSGSQFGLMLLWVLFLGCLFSGIMMEAIGRFSLVTGDTALYGIKTRLRYGRIIALLSMIGVIIGLCSSTIGILGLTSNMIYEGLHLFIPGFGLPEYSSVLGIAVIIILILYAMLSVGRYSFFEKVLVFFVTLMGVLFIISLFIVMPPTKDIAAGLIPRIPDIEGGKLMSTAIVGTTMAGVIFVMRPLLMKGKGWNSGNITDQRKDAAISALLTFIISGSIMGAATGALFHQGRVITRVLDMVYTLEPIAGKYAMAIFLIGALSAGLSSLFPIMMLPAMLISDYRTGTLDTNSLLFRIIAGVMCILGLTVPVFGINPITAQIATQVTLVFVLPLVVASIFSLVNNKRDMGEYRAGLLLNLGIITAFIFSCFIAYTAILAICELL
ncbi:Nramp family divalent metal transporter [Candidatus Latescibacterota bacterium]